MTNEETIAFSVFSVMNVPLHGLQNYLVKKQEVVSSVNEVEASIQNSMDELRSSGHAHSMEIDDNFVSTIANFSLQIVDGLSKVCTEHAYWNSSSDQLASILPLDLRSILLRDFTSL